MNFWQELPKPFFCVAPMADVTDAPFRRLIAKYSNPQQPNCQTLSVGQLERNQFVTWTEFVSADGLTLAPEAGRQKLLADLMYSEAERPIVAQLFSSVPEHMEAAARLCAELGYDGVDINMGCPDRSIEKQGCGSAMIKTPEVAKEIIQAAKGGAGDVPVSVKTRLGYLEEEIETWIPTLLEAEPAALTIHCRTRKDLSKVPARWDRLPRIIELRDAISPDTRVIGNGDVLSMEDAHQKAESSGADGVMVGRALFGNPWFFHPTKRVPERLTALPTHGVNREDILETDTSNAAVEYVSTEERLQVLVEHSKLFAELLSFKSFNIMKKHYKAYVSGWPGAAELRTQLMAAGSADEVEMIVHQWLTNQA